LTGQGIGTNTDRHFKYHAGGNKYTVDSASFEPAVFFMEKFKKLNAGQNQNRRYNDISHINITIEQLAHKEGAII
jgi:hypothetical protein